MSIKNLKNEILHLIPMDRNPKFNIMVKDFDILKKPKNLSKKEKSSISVDGKVKEFIVTDIIEVSFEQWNQIYLFNEAISIYNQFDISWSLLINNLNDLKSYISENLSKKKVTLDVEKEGCLRALNSKLVNAVSSIYIFYNNIIGLAERNLSEEMSKEIIGIFNKMFDESFAYRFSYQLRGFVNHRNLPLELIHTDLITDEVKLNLNITKLLKSSFSWNAKVKSELIKMESISIKILLLELFATYFNHYESIQTIFKKEIIPFTTVFDEINFKHNHLHSYSLKAYWDEAKIKEVKQTEDNPDDLNSIMTKNNYNMIEFDLNLARLEIIKGGLGFTIAPRHFTTFYSNLSAKL